MLVFFDVGSLARVYYYFILSSMSFHLEKKVMCEESNLGYYKPDHAVWKVIGLDVDDEIYISREFSNAYFCEVSTKGNAEFYH